MQEDDNGIDRHVCYFSKKLNKHQCNCSTIEKACLALILALTHFEVYISSSAVHPTIVFSDHNPLTFIDKVRCKNQRLLRWSFMLQEFNIEIRHIRGKDNIIADAIDVVLCMLKKNCKFYFFFLLRGACFGYCTLGIDYFSVLR